MKNLVRETRLIESSGIGIKIWPYNSVWKNLYENSGHILFAGQTDTRVEEEVSNGGQSPGGYR